MGRDNNDVDRHIRMMAPPTTSRRFGWVFLILLLVAGSLCRSCNAQVVCFVTADCEKVLSFSGDVECIDGFCSNPFRRGCLQPMDREKGTAKFQDFQQRVCNSDDAASGDYSSCLVPTSLFETYDEIRVAPGDWESSIFLSWIIQILLGEILRVPVTIETSAPRSAGSASFYDETNGMVYAAVPYNCDALRRANALNADCTQANRENGTDACAHILPEVWSGQIDAYTAALQEGFIEAPEGNGMVGEFSFMIPQFLAEQDPSLTSWHGLRDRKKMASLFKRPTTWLEYCQEVSPNDCAVANKVAMRSPLTPDEEASYFLAGLYQGHFRATDKNNCTKYPDTCTGHVVDPPCDWDTLTESQMYWNNIPLSADGPLEPNNGYTYFQMIEIWNAANATQSPIFQWWWKPDSLDQLFANTSFALQPVFLPPPSEDCEKNRVSSIDRCGDDPTARLGTPLGSCDFPPHSLQKILSTSLLASTLSQDEGARSPAYEFLKLLRVSDLSLTIMLRNWIRTEVDRYGIDPRVAVCEWVYDNIDELSTKFIPLGYPRDFEEETSSTMFVASFAMGFLALAMAVASLVGTIVYRENLIFKYAHVPFVLWVLLGLTMVCTGAILVAPPQPSNLICITQPYLISLGYTIELMPLVVKVSAVNHLISESKKMRKVQLDTNRLHLQVGGVAFCVLIYLVVWSILDTPSVIETPSLVEIGEPLINVSTACRSGASTWVVAANVWQGLLLLSATILAVQSRNVQQEFNESQSLAFMVYSHVLFLVLRALISSLPPENFWASNIQSGATSLCLSLDSINTLLVYFGPKFYKIARKRDVRVRTPSSLEKDQSMFASAGVGSQSRARSRVSRLSFADSSVGQNNDSSVVLNFEEPPPSGEEVKTLMGEVCDLLVAAAVLQDQKSGEEVVQQQVEPETIGHNEAKHDLEGGPTQETYFMKKDELLMFRSICSRLAKARFDFEKAGTIQGGTIQGGTIGKSSLKTSSLHTKGRSMTGRNSMSVSFADDDSSTRSSDSEVGPQLGTSKDHPTSTTPFGSKNDDGVAVHEKATLQESAPPIPLIPLETTDEAFASTFSASDLCQQRIDLDEEKPVSCWSPIDNNDAPEPQDSSIKKMTVVPASIEPPSLEEKATRISLREVIREQRRKQSKNDLAEIRQRRQERLAEREGKESQLESSCPSISL
jgi:hypothetical protein